MINADGKIAEEEIKLLNVIVQATGLDKLMQELKNNQ